MWLLRDDEKGLVYRIIPGKQLIVSRKDGDLLLLGDQSISRKHAQLFIENDNTGEGVVLKDLQSKYGTFTIIGEREITQLPPNQEVTLKDGDCVRFGIQWNCWRVERVPLVVATSTLSQSEKAEVKQLLDSLGGLMLSEWSTNCTHLTMNKLTVTVKVVCALAAGQPIVTPRYWRALREALNVMQTTLPDCKDHQPPLAEAVLNPAEVSFAPNPARSKLFAGLTFIASTPKQLSRVKPMVDATGGSAVVFSSDFWSEKKLLERKTILMQHSANEVLGSQQSQIPDGYIDLTRKLVTQGVRCIPESEIGLAVLYCSTSRYCNPCFSPQSLLNPESAPEPNTEETSSSGNSNSATAGSLHTKKRMKELVPEGEEEHPKKRPKSKPASEDIFSNGSQNMDFKETEENPMLTHSKTLRSMNLNNGDSTNGSKHSTNKDQPVAVVRSLDMFAPSGSVGSNNPMEVRPSCEDMFASRSTRSSHGSDKGSKNVDVSSPKQSKLPAIVEDKNDDFSFSNKRKFSRVQMEVEDDVDDDFSFRSFKQTKPQEVLADVDDEFQFSSVRRSKKRPRQSNPDIFEDNVESPVFIKNGNPVAGPSKVGKNIQKEKSCPKNEDELLFEFPMDRASKNKKDSNILSPSEGNESEFKVALLCRKKEVSDNPHQQNDSKPFTANCNESYFDDKNRTTYSKTSVASVKTEVEDEDIDELARELHNATIVVLKPLVMSRPTPVATSVQGTSGKNFKKFKKVVGVNKRVIPHIIGGSDLVPHQKESPLPDNLRLHLPEQQSPDDDWTFLGDKKKGRGR